MQNGAWLQGQGMMITEQNDPLWEQVGTGLRIAYAVGTSPTFHLLRLFWK